MSYNGESTLKLRFNYKESTIRPSGNSLVIGEIYNVFTDKRAVCHSNKGKREERKNVLGEQMSFGILAVMKPQLLLLGIIFLLLCACKKNSVTETLLRKAITTYSDGTRDSIIYSYDANNRIIEFDMYNSVNIHSYSTFTWDAEGFLTSISFSGSPSLPVHHDPITRHYTYCGNGAAIDSTAFTYTNNKISLMQHYSLSSGIWLLWETRTYTYDASGNALQQLVTRYGSGGPQIYNFLATYDTHINPLQLNDAGIVMYMYPSCGGNNLLTETSDPGGGPITNVNCTYTYNSNNMPDVESGMRSKFGTLTAYSSKFYY